jgi:hypothetical protein
VASDGIVFDVLATDTVVVDALNVHLAAGTFPLEIYFRRGTHVGAETNAALWTLLGSQADLVSSGPAEYTAVPFAASVQLEAGETGAFYVNTGAASSGVLSRAGVNVGDEVLDDGNAVIVAGNAISGVFGTVGAVSIAEAMLAYDVCGP